MAEFGSYPLWGMGPHSLGPIDPAVLPLMSETLERLQSWIDQYQAQLDKTDPANSSMMQGQALVAFDEEGAELWRKLREELSPEYEVAYFSERLHRVLSTPEELNADNEQPDSQ
jgi:hypothetical protein